MLTTDDARIAERVRRFRNHGIDSDASVRERTGSWFYAMRELGFNYRLTDVQSALGLSQLGKLSAWTARREMIAKRYAERLSTCAALELPTVRSDRTHAWHLYPVRLRRELLRVDRGEVFRALQAENIGVNVHYIPVPWHPYYQSLGYTKGNWPVAESAYERLLSLPMFASMTDEDVEDVCVAAEKVLGYYER
jgi:dTDP-4-amino-4,6-dideoxygalactose transaminase